MGILEEVRMRMEESFAGTETHLQSDLGMRSMPQRAGTTVKVSRLSCRVSSSHKRTCLRFVPAIRAA
jgi:hypothetical protein